MTTHFADLGTIDNIEHVAKDISIPGIFLVIGGAAIGAYVGFRIGGPVGAAVGALVSAFVGALAAGYIREFTVILHSSGKVEVKYSTRF